jgi:hypothetical protein
MHLVPLGLVGLLLLVLVVGAVRFFARTAAPIEAIRAWAEAQGHAVRGDGTSAPLEVIGARGARRWTVGWFQAPGADAVLLLGMDCAASDTAPTDTAPIDTAASPEDRPRVDDGVLAARVTRPSPDLFAPARLDALLDELEAMAIALEREHPAPPDAE